ncbi:hypothetical protein CR513_38821, partial [Mucuna pruriens]
MKAFPFSLDKAAKDWLYLQPALFNTWGDMKRTFLEKFFSASRTTQHTREILHEYWERFNKLCATCPHHQINEQLLIHLGSEGRIHIGYTGSSLIRIGHLIVNSMEDNHFGQDRIKGLIQLNNSGPHRIDIRGKQPTPQYQVPPFQQQQQQQRMPTPGNSPSLEDLMKQLATSNLEFQQSVSSSNMQFQQNVTATI